MLNLITINECIMIVNINTKTNNHKYIILTNIPYTMLNLITINVCRYNLHTVHQIVFELRWIPQSCSCSSNEVSPWRNSRWRSAPATECPCDKMTGDKVSPQQNGCRRSVSAMKRRRRNCETWMIDPIKRNRYKHSSVGEGGQGGQMPPHFSGLVT